MAGSKRFFSSIGAIRADFCHWQPSICLIIQMFLFCFMFPVMPEYWWRRHKEWAARTQVLPGQKKLQRTLQLGWNRKVTERRPEVAALIAALKKRVAD
jgi:hypothetical protein